MSFTTDKPKAIIYCAENNISGKKYIGKTTRSLDARKKEHFRKTIKYNHKFANALNYYSRDSWKWYVLAEVEYEKVDEYEQFFISDLDTYNNGYNSMLDNPFIEYRIKSGFNSEILSVYHPEYGVVSGTRKELIGRYPELEYIRNLLSKKRKSINGWVLAEHRETYTSFLERKGSNTVITLTHRVHGTYTLSPKEFLLAFSLEHYHVSRLANKKVKTAKGWRLVTEREDDSKTKD